MPPKSFPSRPTFLFFFMASFLSFFLLVLLSLSSPSSSLSKPTKHHFPKPKPKTPSFSSNVPSQVIQACNAARFPDICQSTLSNSPPNPTPLQIIQSSLSISSDRLEAARSMVNSILESSRGNLNRTTAAKNCQEVLNNSHYRIQSTSAILSSGNGKTKDARAYMSAALLFQYDCWNALKYANDTSLTNQTMSFIDSLMMVTSNTLGMVRAYDIFGEKLNSWGPPKTERDGFWEVTSSSSGDYLNNKEIVPSVPNLKADVTVCKDGSEGCFKTVQEAVNTAPDNKVDGKFVIYIKEGVYEEVVRVPLEKKNLVFLGDGMAKTIITNSATVGQPGISTYNTATVAVLGDGFMASNLTIQNTAGAPTHQAVAFRSDSDLSIIENCEFLGNQDTLYAHALRQFYKSCRIQGNVDFIFGNSAAVFHDCEILVAPRQEKPEKGENNAVTAHGRTDPAQSTGFVFQNCLINGTKEYMALYNSKPNVHRNYLGRPWKEYSRVVFIKCQLEALITPPGWMPWSGDFALKTLYYGEFQNTGPGSASSERVQWSSQIPAEHVGAYSLQNFIQGNDWISTSS